jgi:hypothetical protein
MWMWCGVVVSRLRRDFTAFRSIGTLPPPQRSTCNGNAVAMVRVHRPLRPSARHMHAHVAGPRDSRRGTGCDGSLYKGKGTRTWFIWCLLYAACRTSSNANANVDCQHSCIVTSFSPYISPSRRGHLAPAHSHALWRQLRRTRAPSKESHTSASGPRRRRPPQVHMSLALHSSITP